jgi:aryl-alcohol dehydrogenase-like predicted oxidoreductase
MVMEAVDISDKLGIARYISEQPPYNLLDRRIENELIPLALKHGLAILPWSPLAGGILAGKYTIDMLGDGSFPESSRAARAGAWFRSRVTRNGVVAAGKVADMAAERGITAAQLATLWCKDQPGVTSPIVGPRTMTHLDEALAVLEMDLSEEDAALLDEIVHPGNVVADFHNSNPWMKARITD